MSTVRPWFYLTNQPTDAAIWSRHLVNEPSVSTTARPRGAKNVFLPRRLPCLREIFMCSLVPKGLENFVDIGRRLYPTEERREMAVPSSRHCF